MMNLYILPDKPGRKQGYSIAVESDVKRLNPASNDLIIWYLSSGKADNSNEYLLQRPGPIAFRRIKTYFAIMLTVKYLHPTFPLLILTRLMRSFAEK